MLDNGRIYSHIDVAFDPLYKRICAHCDEISPTRLKYCSSCRTVRYCDPVCQRLHWRSAHKLVCKKIMCYQQPLQQGDDD